MLSEALPLTGLERLDLARLSGQRTPLVSISPALESHLYSTISDLKNKLGLGTQAQGYQNFTD